MDKDKVLNRARLLLLVSYYLTFFIPVYPGLAVSQMNSGGVYSGIFLVLIFINLYSMYFEKALINVSMIMMLTGMLVFSLFLYYGKLDGEYLSIAFYLQLVIFIALVIVAAYKEAVFSLVEVLKAKQVAFKDKHCKKESCSVEEDNNESEK